jgi:dihydroorotase
LKRIQIAPANDLHVHFRQDDESMLKNVVKHTAARCARALVMPNTKIPVTTGGDVARDYKKIKEYGGYMEPLMTIKIDANCTPEKIRGARKAGAVAGKIYPEGLTTNSEGGITRDMFYEMPKPFLDNLAELEKCGMVLCVHGEMPGFETMCREQKFLDWLQMVLFIFPNLRFVMEHITTKEAVEFVKAYELNNLAATITVHHMILTLDDIIGDKLNPHAFCKPVPKLLKDRGALREAAMSNDSRFFLGTDSAPHLVKNKECNGGCAGVYTAPVMTEALVQLFDDMGELDKLENFTTRFGELYYGLTPVTEKIAVERDSWRVPDIIDGVVPLYAGKVLNWRLSR